MELLFFQRRSNYLTMYARFLDFNTEGKLKFSNEGFKKLECEVHSLFDDMSHIYNHLIPKYTT